MSYIDSPQYQLTVLHSRVLELVEELSDEELYDAIFNPDVSQKIHRLFREMGIYLEYYDPDTSYDEDVEAFVSAFTSYMDDL